MNVYIEVLNLKWHDPYFGLCIYCTISHLQQDTQGYVLLEKQLGPDSMQYYWIIMHLVKYQIKAKIKNY